MDAWLIYLKERFPLPVYLLLVLGFSGTGAAWSLHAKSELSGVKLILSSLVVLLFFALLRLMDERKDYEKDLLAHPERPLPRGILSLVQVERAIIVGIWLLVGSAIFVSFTASVILIAISLHLWLMYKEFYVPHWLEARPIVYALSHQLITVSLTAFCVVLHAPQMALDASVYQLGCMVMGGFFGYEVCRKYDPNAHPVLKTYRQMYGLKGSFFLVLLSQILSAMMAWDLGLFPYIATFNVLTVLGAGVLAARNHKVAEVLGALGLFAHLWTLIFINFQSFAGMILP